jgi:hypothetical protein
VSSVFTGSCDEFGVLTLVMVYFIHRFASLYISVDFT